MQDINLETATVLKVVPPLINSGAAVAREPNVADPPSFAGARVTSSSFLRWPRRWTIVAASRNCSWERPRAETPRSPSPS